MLRPAITIETVAVHSVTKTVEIAQIKITLFCAVLLDFQGIDLDSG